MPRLLFEKKENAVWISHLDLMRLFQRAFKRADLHLTHTHGYNPRPSVSIALPLSVGIESQCEVLEFDLDGDAVSCNEIKNRLNSVLVEGISVLDVYTDGQKYGELSLLECEIVLEYDNDIPSDACKRIHDLLHRSPLILPKKTKSGIQEQDISQMIQNLNVNPAGERTLLIQCTICCQNPTLNPAQITLAITTFLPEYTPACSKCKRIEIFDKKGNIFR